MTNNTHTHSFDSDLSSITVDMRTATLVQEPPRFTCSCGYFTTYHNGLEWHDADGNLIEPGTP